MEGLEFNVSHCEELLAIGVASCALGVDLERVREAAELDRLAEDVLSPEERWLLKGPEDADGGEGFYLAWTAKEATLKGLGLGLSIDPRTVRPRPIPGGFYADVPQGLEGGSQWWVSSFRLPARHGHQGAVGGGGDGCAWVGHRDLTQL